ncbi:MAG: spondin domain-containing protein [Blastocatellia bacterium]
MLRKKIILGIAAAAVLFLGINANNVAFAKAKKTATFKVRIENISNGDGLATADGTKYPFALSPGMFIVNHKKQYFFDEGRKADNALELQAEDGNPEPLSKKLLTKVGSVHMGIFNTPNGAGMPGPLLPGNSYEFTFTGSEGMKLNLIAMYGQSNDLFYAPKSALDLFDANGNALSGDITESLLLWDAGTEVNQAPGIGDEQAPRQKMANTGKAENGVVQLVKDSFTYPNTKDVLRVTITAQ